MQITVLRRLALDDLSERYIGTRLGPCQSFAEGDVFYTQGYDKPEGFCSAAWDAIGKLAAVLAMGGLAYGRKANVACCNDGVRPVIFLLEAVDN